MHIDIKIVCEIAKKAGTAIMEIYGKGNFSVEYKDDKSPLTAADKASHEVIMFELKKRFPEIPILSEEGADIPYEVRKDWQRFWLVDPLDGTKEFIKRNGEFTVNIALVEGGQPVLGVVYVPVQDKLYFGTKNGGSFSQQGNEPSVAIRVRTSPPDEGLTVVMSRSHPSPELEAYLKDIKVAESLPVGSSLKLCVVAEGKADLYPRLTLSGQAAFTANEPGNLFSEEALGYSFGPRLSWGIFNLPLTRAQIDQAEAEARAAKAGFESAVIQALTETDAALESYNLAVEEAALRVRALGSAERALDLVELRYKEGADSLLSLIDAQRQTLSARDAEVQARHEALRRRVAVHRAFGG